MSWTDQCPAQAPGIDLKLGFSACQSHMTAMMAMPPVVPVNHRPLRAVTHVIAMIDAEDAFHAADDAADCCANHRADRASDAVALIEAMRSAAGNALCLCGERHRKRYEKQAGNKQVLFHEVIPFEVRGFRRHDGARNWHPMRHFGGGGLLRVNRDRAIRCRCRPLSAVSPIATKLLQRSEGR